MDIFKQFKKFLSFIHFCFKRKVLPELIIPYRITTKLTLVSDIWYTRIFLLGIWVKLDQIYAEKCIGGKNLLMASKLCNVFPTVATRTTYDGIKIKIRQKFQKNIYFTILPLFPVISTEVTIDSLHFNGILLQNKWWRLLK